MRATTRHQLRSLLSWRCRAQTYQWVDAALRPDSARVDFLDKLNTFLAESVFLTGHRVTVADFVTYYLVHAVAVSVCAVLFCSHW